MLPEIKLYFYIVFWEKLQQEGIHIYYYYKKLSMNEV